MNSATWIINLDFLFQLWNSLYQINPPTKNNDKSWTQWFEGTGKQLTQEDLLREVHRHVNIGFFSEGNFQVTE